MTEKTGTSACAAQPANRGWPVQASCIKKALRVSLPGRSKIGLLEHCGTGNLGDDATVTTVLEQIKSRWPSASVVGLSLDPLDSERRHGVPCFAIRQSVFPFEQEWSRASPAVRRGRYSDRLKARFKKIGPLYRATKAMKNAVIVWPIQFVREIIFLWQSLFLALRARSDRDMRRRPTAGLGRAVSVPIHPVQMEPSRQVRARQVHLPEQRRGPTGRNLKSLVHQARARDG
jgi:polysaccharide pyruvyl transferase WcaK-like protein